jgi:hypothetical protein
MAYANGKLSRPWFVDGDHETVVGVDRAKKAMDPTRPAGTDVNFH